MSLNLNPAIEWIADLGVGTSAGQPTSTIDASGFSVGVTNLTVLGTGNAILYGGSGGGDTLTASGSGNDVLIGNGAGDALTDTGTGRNILIGGGPGGDALVGNGNDILVGGTTEYDSHTPTISRPWTPSWASGPRRFLHGADPDDQEGCEARGGPAPPLLCRCVQFPHHPYRPQR